MPRRGENIFHRKDGRWEARVIHHYEVGKAKYRSYYGATYAEAKAKKQAALIHPAQKNRGTHLHATFEEAALAWLEESRIGVKEATFARYNRIVTKYLVPQFKNHRLAKIEPNVLAATAQRLLTCGRKKKQLAPKTVSDMICVLNMILKYAYDHQYPCPALIRLKYPAKEKKQISVLSEASRQKIEQQLFHFGDKTSLGVIFALYTGIRIGELCGLRWGDVDFAQKTVTISRTVERISDCSPDAKKKTKVILSQPKTASSWRVIPLPDFLLNALEPFRQAPEIYLITGKPIYTEPHQFYVRYRRFLAQLGLEPCSFHTLRHTFATRCVENGADAKTLAEVLGHASVTTTLSVYVHPTLQQKRRMMEGLAPTKPRLLP